ncbi:adenosylcobinamide-GDP ribazoletransferase [Metapseudomonas resinovorans]|uniref:adenosylcobinamide-GDP ribazoletransferase n=1 Tax=Metapseudomonas resinovorans TaxID=53412 RepID=UPI0009858343|nr:adenosylcobinamide-GDP ribazoletransferase [Pseudomonas resinovorans]GLZ88386.1 adenosylcobinamide-GDP ribazoletransferase [Pseudomonas resinovorans]
MTPLLIALQFLTRLPVRLPGMPEPEQIGRSLLWYPLVGLLIGALLLGGAWLLDGHPPLLSAALLLALWVGLSGGLHLDGLADTADAWVGGYGDRERTLTIMKDPRSGPIAVVVLVVVLLLKFAALVTLLDAGHLLPLLLAPWLARGMLPLLFLTTPYVRPGGLGQAIAEHLPRRELPVWLGGQAVVMLLLGWAAWIALVAALVLFGWLRGRFMQRLGGTTGDTAGALVELVEVGVLVGVALFA